MKGVRETDVKQIKQKEARCHSMLREETAIVSNHSVPGLYFQPWTITESGFNLNSRGFFGFFYCISDKNGIHNPSDLQCACLDFVKVWSRW